MTLKLCGRLLPFEWFWPSRFTKVSPFLIISVLRMEDYYQKPRAKNHWQGLPVEEIVFDFTEECEIPLMTVNSDIDVEKDMPFAGPSRTYFLMKPWSFSLCSRNMENRDNKCQERAVRLVYDDFRDLHFWELKVIASV